MSERDVWAAFGQPGFYWVRPNAGVTDGEGWTVAQVMADGEVYIVGQDERISDSRREGQVWVRTLPASVEVGPLLHAPGDQTGPRSEPPHVGACPHGLPSDREWLWAGLAADGCITAGAVGHRVTADAPRMLAAVDTLDTTLRSLLGEATAPPAMPEGFERPACSESAGGGAAAGRPVSARRN
jgi:hypothetical protein